METNEKTRTPAPGWTTWCLVAILACGAAAQQRLYVDAAAPPGGNGSSWSKAFTTLQQALAKARSGTEIWTARGLYSGPLQVPAGVRVLGGFRPGDRRTTRREVVVNRTAVSGNGRRAVTLGPDSVLDGFLITSGRAGAPGGGAVLVDGVRAVVRACVLRLNTDTAGRGAAVLVRRGGELTLENSVLYFNGGPGSGATIEVDGARARLVNLTVDDNTGTAIRLQNGSRVEVWNCVLSKSTSYGIHHVAATDRALVRNCAFFANKLAAYRYVSTNLKTPAEINRLAWASGNVGGDPRFVAPNDYRLKPGSPCIDAGDPAGAPTGARDLYDGSRLNDGDLDLAMRIDIGAHEFSNVTLSLTPHAGHGHLHPYVGGTPGRTAALLASPGVIPDGWLIAPLGYWFLDLRGTVVLPVGKIPQTLTINVPKGVPPGVATFWQALATDGKGVNVSNPRDLEFR